MASKNRCNLSGNFYELDEDKSLRELVSQAVVTPTKMKLGWYDNDNKLGQAVLDSDDGYYYWGHFGYPELDEANTCEGWLYKADSGDLIFWMRWDMATSGINGTSILSLVAESDTVSSTSHTEQTTRETSLDRQMEFETRLFHAEQELSELKARMKLLEGEDSRTRI